MSETKPETCTRCDGCGQIDDGEGAPWSMWEALPPGSDTAVRLGLVSPVVCPSCGGSGSTIVVPPEQQEGEQR